MSRISRDHKALLSQIAALSGGALPMIENVQEWHSATFAGHRIELSLILKEGDCLGRAQTFNARVQEHEFELPRQFVADILVMAITQTPDNDVAIKIEALLLDL